MADVADFDSVVADSVADFVQVADFDSVVADSVADFVQVADFDSVVADSVADVDQHFLYVGDLLRVDVALLQGPSMVRILFAVVVDCHVLTQQPQKNFCLLSLSCCDKRLLLFATFEQWLVAGQC